MLGVLRRTGGASMPAATAAVVPLPVTASDAATFEDGGVAERLALAAAAMEDLPGAANPLELCYDATSISAPLSTSATTETQSERCAGEGSASREELCRKYAWRQCRSGSTATRRRTWPSASTAWQQPAAPAPSSCCCPSSATIPVRSTRRSRPG